MKLSYLWKLSDLKSVEKNNKTVFTTFACGGGSSMGYKLAGYTVLGANDIDKQMQKVYCENHHPELYYLDDIRDFNKKIEAGEVDQRLFNLDILDGSPPCSTFSMAGSREANWGKEKKFREGQSKQVLDDLFFHYIRTAELLKPKVIIAENVKGILAGNSKGYVIEIVRQLDQIGYTCQVFLLNGATMGVPQQRERVFFIGHKKEFDLPKLVLNFNEPLVPFRDIDEGNTPVDNKMSKSEERYWRMTKPGQALSSVHPKGFYFGFRKISPNQVANTILAGSSTGHFKYPRKLNNSELVKIGSFPLDYNFLNIKPQYLIGMSVPPLMTARVSNEVYLQWLSKL